MSVTMNQQWADQISKDVGMALAEIGALRQACRVLLQENPGARHRLEKWAASIDEHTLFAPMTEWQRERAKLTLQQLAAPDEPAAK